MGNGMSERGMHFRMFKSEMLYLQKFVFLICTHKLMKKVIKIFKTKSHVVHVFKADLELLCNQDLELWILLGLTGRHPHT